MKEERKETIKEDKKGTQSKRRTNTKKKEIMQNVRVEGR